MFFLALSLAFTSAMAWDCCAAEKAGHESHASKESKALDGHHCASQHAMDERNALPTIAYVELPDIHSVAVAHRPVVYHSLSHDPLLQPPVNA